MSLQAVSGRTFQGSAIILIDDVNCGVQLSANVDLSRLHTFGMKVNAFRYIQVETVEQLQQVLKLPETQTLPLLILGGGSNILFTRDFPGLIIHIAIATLNFRDIDDREVWVEAGAGIIWDDLVHHCVQRNYGGLENLSLIPGTVGAAPMQNIGAYGVEVAQVIQEVLVMSRETGEITKLHSGDCLFGYRESIFKNQARDKFIILGVTFRLSKREHEYHVTYGNIRELLEQRGQKPSLESIRQAVIDIRRSKLPDPRVIGNAGSFFKNPVIDQSHYLQLKADYPTIPGYPAGDQQVKLAAGWLIEQAGWKGRSWKGAGVHDKQALVLVNRMDATGSEVLELCEQIVEDVARKFAVKLQPEVNII